MTNFSKFVIRKDLKYYCAISQIDKLVGIRYNESN